MVAAPAQLTPYRPGTILMAGGAAPHVRYRHSKGSFGGSPEMHTAREDRGYSWHKVTESADFPPRDGAGALVYRDKMWPIGGWNPLKLTRK